MMSTIAVRRATTMTLLLMSCVAGLAQENPPATTLNEAAVEAFFDAVVAEELEKHDVPGAIVTIVKDGRIVLSKGYGWASIEDKIPVSAETTLFRVGSLSKLVTATATIMLTETDKDVTLESDARNLIGPARLAQALVAPATLGQLLNHTSGFDVTDIGDAARDIDGLLPLSDVVSRHMPPRIHAPGRYHLYTNHGYALLGLVIEARRGVPFAQAIREDVFEPLRMTSSSFAQPLPGELQARAAVGYDYTEGEYRALPFDFSNVAPADALVTTGQDMGRFMMEHLRIYGLAGMETAGGLLRPETMRRMHARSFAYHENLDGYAYGFREEQMQGRGERVLAHTGGQLGFTSKLLIVPQLQLGLFICTNRRLFAMRGAVEAQFFEEFFPPDAGSRAPRGLLGNPGPGPEMNEGSYLDVSLPSHGVESLASLLSPEAVLKVEWAKGALWAGPFGALEPRVGGLFRSGLGGADVAFGHDASGRASDFYTGTRAYRRLAWHENPTLHRPVLLGTILLCLAGLGAWPLEGRRRKANSPPVSRDRIAAWAKAAVMMSCLGVVVFAAWTAVELVRASGVGWDYGLPASVKALLLLPYALAALCVALWVLAAMAWRRGFWSPAWRAFYLLIAAALTSTLFVLARWNLIGF